MNGWTEWLNSGSKLYLHRWEQKQNKSIISLRPSFLKPPQKLVPSLWSLSAYSTGTVRLSKRITLHMYTLMEIYLQHGDWTDHAIHTFLLLNYTDTFPNLTPEANELIQDNKHEKKKKKETQINRQIFFCLWWCIKQNDVWIHFTSQPFTTLFLKYLNVFLTDIIIYILF